MVSKAFHFTIHRCRGQLCHPSRGVQLCTSLRNKINKLVTKPVKLMWHLIWRWGPAVPSVGSEGTIVSRWKFGSPLLTNWFVRRTARESLISTTYFSLLGKRAWLFTKSKKGTTLHLKNRGLYFVLGLMMYFSLDKCKLIFCAAVEIPTFWILD